MAAAVRDNRTYLSAVPLVLLQNGVRSANLVTGLLDRRQLIGAVVRLAATYLRPGSVTVIHRGALLLGCPGGQATRDAIDTVLTAAETGREQATVC